LSLFAAGVVLFVLLVASYSGRRFWLALASTAVSMAAFVGFLFVAVAKDPASIRAGLVWTAGKLQLVVDRETADMIGKAIERIPASVAVVATSPTEVPAPAPSAEPSAPETVGTAPPVQVAPPSPCEDGEQPPCDTGAAQANADSAAAPEPPAPQAEPMQATSTPSFPAAKPAPTPKPTPGTPVVWFLDDQPEQAAGTGGAFAINGMNASDQPFDEVHAVLKPDGGRQEIALALNVAGKTSDGVIPAGARFSLGVASGKQEQIGGAILTFRYRQNGQVRTSIVYLTPAMISRFANRG
jgi:hypothetical protein